METLFPWLNLISLTEQLAMSGTGANIDVIYHKIFYSVLH
jgi:hypothetical protein